jgi:hypothetical protein
MSLRLLGCGIPSMSSRRRSSLSHPRTPANARGIALVSPLLADPLATLLDSLAQRLDETIPAGG